MLELLKPTLKRFERNPSFEILASLAEQPISLRRIHGFTWPEIEQQFLRAAALLEPSWDALDTHLMRYIELAEFTNFTTPDAWQAAVAESLFATKTEIDARLRNIGSFRAMSWDEQLGALIFTN